MPDSPLHINLPDPLLERGGFMFVGQVDDEDGHGILVSERMMG